MPIATPRRAVDDQNSGLMEPYATSHEALDKDEAFQQEVMNVARALAHAVKLARSGRLDDPATGIVDPVPK